jgi:hypothetical protein
MHIDIELEYKYNPKKVWLKVHYINQLRKELWQLIYSDSNACGVLRTRTIFLFCEKEKCNTYEL